VQFNDLSRLGMMVIRNALRGEATLAYLKATAIKTAVWSKPSLPGIS